MTSRQTCVGLLMLVAAGLAAAGVGAAQAGDDWTLQYTKDGQPDLHGIWANNAATPLERPEIFGEKARLTDEELAQLKAKLEAVRGNLQAGDLLGDYLIQKVLEDPEFRGFDQDTGNYNSFWLVDRELDNRTSLVIDPPNGRIPVMKPEAAKRAMTRGGAGYAGRSPAGPEDLAANVRCISYGVPNLLAGYNSYFQIVQTKTHVAILQELIHDVRIIPLGDQPHLAGGIRQWHGDSRGRWEEDTLVVETTNYNEAGAYRGASENLKVTERFRRVGRDTLEWEVTFADEETWERPWTLMVVLERSEEPIFEYACHEGNYGLEGILSGARALEKTSDAGRLTPSRTRDSF